MTHYPDNNNTPVGRLMAFLYAQHNDVRVRLTSYELKDIVQKPEATDQELSHLLWSLRESGWLEFDSDAFAIERTTRLSILPKGRSLLTYFPQCFPIEQGWTQRNKLRWMQNSHVVVRRVNDD